MEKTEKWIMSWADLDFWKSPEYSALKGKLKKEPHLPKTTDVFRSLLVTPLEEVRVVIIGQDPYPTPGMAHGLSFSVHRDWKGRLPPTLENIYKELAEDQRIIPPLHGDLSAWAEEGVLLWNTHLTVAPGQPMSHRDWGWKKLTEEVILACVQANSNTVFVLWGEEAKSMKPLFPKHNFVASPHPSPLSAHRGFFGSRPFTKVNSLLSNTGQGFIDWGKICRG